MKYDLKDTTFLIYTRIDSEDRYINLELVIKHIFKYFKTNILLLETDKTSKTKEIIRKNSKIQYKFKKDDNTILHTTKYRNYLIELCNTPFFFVCDTDVIVSPKAIVRCVDILKKSTKNTLVYPYNGNFCNVPKKYRNIYAKSSAYNVLKKNEDKFPLWFRYSVGGIYGGKTKDFKEKGSDNEKIFGWGPDDKERYYRLKKEGFEIKRDFAPLYHLYHDRKINSWHASEKMQEKNYKEFLKVFTK